MEIKKGKASPCDLVATDGTVITSGTATHCGKVWDAIKGDTPPQVDPIEQVSKVMGVPYYMLKRKPKNVIEALEDLADSFDSTDGMQLETDHGRIINATIFFRRGVLDSAIEGIDRVLTEFGFSVSGGGIAFTIENQGSGSPPPVHLTKSNPATL